MTNAELIAKIKDFANEQKDLLEGFELQSDFRRGETAAYSAIISFLSTLESEKPMVQKGLDVTDFCKPIDPGIAQCIADHSWEMLGEDEKSIPNDLEEAAEKHASSVEGDYAFSEGPDHYCSGDLEDAFIAGAKWQADHAPLPEDTVLFNNGVAKWRRLAEEEQADLFTIVALDAAQRAKEQMMNEAVEGTVMDFSSNQPRPQVDVLLDPHKYHTGDKVRVIVCKKEDKPLTE